MYYEPQVLSVSSVSSVVNAFSMPHLATIPCRLTLEV